MLSPDIVMLQYHHSDHYFPLTWNSFYFSVSFLLIPFLCISITCNKKRVVATCLRTWFRIPFSIIIAGILLKIFINSSNLVVRNQHDQHQPHMSKYILWYLLLLTTNREQEPKFSISVFQTMKLQNFSFLQDLSFHVMILLAIWNSKL